MPDGGWGGLKMERTDEMVHERLRTSDMDNNFGPRIEWNGGECPIPDAKAGDYKVKFRSGATGLGQVPLDWKHIARHADFDIIAYRVRIPADDLLRQAIEALRPFADFIGGNNQMPDDMPLTRGSGMARRQVTAGQFRKARSVLAAYDKRGGM